jgi:hypothetical protein
MPREQPTAAALSEEFADADVGDARLCRRLGLLADRLADRPGKSFPKALDDAELELLLELGWRAREAARSDQ